MVKPYVCPADGRLSVPLTDQDGLAAAYGSYVGVRGSDLGKGVLDSFPATRMADITDGTSSTLLIGERPPPDSLLAGRWYTWTMPSLSRPYGPDGSMWVTDSTRLDDICVGPFPFGPGRLDNPCDRYHFWSLHAGGANFALADGSVRYLAYSAAPLVPALATRAGGEAVAVP